MRATLREALTAAIKARDRVAVAALRSALAAIDNAEAVPSAATGAAEGITSTEHVAGAAAGLGAAEAQRRTLTDADVRAIVEQEVTERLSSAEDYERLGRTDPAERLRAEAAVLTRHLPQP
ncbi:GatB/YqeY domain-containing protein [Prauserella cavernicola]|uniref:GatB/YqeY domain-containing protein n=1 Tax=Prauserella cavernicola TaxID=2800127 RepID=A0A934V754_9PSEU|nr:GatB/YqeY domain-containing protein [Prauserella cavernicola]MBK1786388.1 GatB/YqeY domain-containing protein [Prauserella cavernicola]